MHKSNVVTVNVKLNLSEEDLAIAKLELRDYEDIINDSFSLEDRYERREKLVDQIDNLERQLEDAKIRLQEFDRDDLRINILHSFWAQVCASIA